MMQADVKAIRSEGRLLRSIDAILPLLKAQVPAFVAHARVSDEGTQLLAGTGLFQCLVPADEANSVGSLQTFKDAIAAIGRVDAGTAWAASLLVTNTWLAVTAFPAAVANKILNTPGGPRVAGTFARRHATVRRVAGGYHIDEGCWGFNSGVYQSNWNILSLPLPDDEGPDVQAMALLPTSQCEMLNDWDTIGMRASGSTSVRVRTCFVPEECIVTLQDLLGGTSDRVSGHWLTRVPTLPLLATGLVLPILGSAHSALELFVERAAKRPITYTPYIRQADSHVVRQAVGRCSALIDAADLLTTQALATLEDAARGRLVLDALETAKLRRDIGLAASLVWEALDKLMEASGGSGIAADNEINRFWRDAKVTSMHGLITPSTVFELYGAMLCGQPIEGWTV